MFTKYITTNKKAGQVILNYEVLSLQYSKFPGHYLLFKFYNIPLIHPPSTASETPVI
jgi:hypothetical protein